MKKIKRIHPIRKSPRRGLNPALHANPAKGIQESEMDEGLRAIYGNKPDDLHVMTSGGSRLTFFLTRIVAVLAVATVLVLGGLYLSSKGLLFNHTFVPLVLAVEVPQKLKSGEAVTISIPYENPQSVPIASLEINVNLPVGFRVTKSIPEPTDSAEMIYKLGSVNAHDKGVITIDGLWLTSTPSTSGVQAIASYKPANFDSDFSQIASANVETTDSVLTTKMEGPDTAAPGAPISYSVTVTNTGTTIVSGATLDLTLPVGFSVSKSTPAFAPGDLPRWLLGDLKPAGEAKVSVLGVYASDVNGSSGVSAVISLSSTATASQPVHLLTQAETSVSTNVSGGNIRLSLVANGLTGDVTVEPGKDLRLGFRLENTGTMPIIDAVVLLDFQPDKGVPIVWAKASLDGGVMTKDGILFDAKKIGIVNPNEKKTFNLSFPIKAELTATDAQSFSAVARATTAGSTILSTPVNAKVNATVAFAGTAHYYSTDGAAIGTGPMPPQVGQATSYEVMWTVTHGLHALENLAVTAVLPTGVTFSAQQAADAGAVTFDEATRTVHWDVSAITAGASALHAKFYVTATPEASDAGKLMKLLGSSSLRVTDSDTQARIDRDLDPMTTELPLDTFAVGKGIVVAP
ncbi:MAG: hypothetical protein WC802_01740 [Patescibacteria group bacterium]